MVVLSQRGQLQVLLVDLLLVMLDPTTRYGFAAYGFGSASVAGNGIG